MKLREIEVGMVIHCRTQEQALELVKHSGMPLYFADRIWDEYKSETCYCRENLSWWSYSDKDYFVERGYMVIEFEDLIIDERDTDYTLLNKPVLDDHITCELITGEVFDFGGMCNAVEGNGPKGDLLIFRYENGKKFLNLAAVPMSNIKLIRYRNSRETINSVMSENDKEE